MAGRGLKEKKTPEPDHSVEHGTALAVVEFIKKQECLIKLAIEEIASGCKIPNFGEQLTITNTVSENGRRITYVVGSANMLLASMDNEIAERLRAEGIELTDSNQFSNFIVLEESIPRELQDKVGAAAEVVLPNLKFGKLAIKEIVVDFINDLGFAHSSNKVLVNSRKSQSGDEVFYTISFSDDRISMLLELGLGELITDKLSAGGLKFVSSNSQHGSMVFSEPILNKI